jgi:hypothetical protein
MYIKGCNLVRVLIKILTFKLILMQVFTVNKRFWTTDHDGWQNWIESTIISYHATIEGANAKICSFPDKDEEITDEHNEIGSVYFISTIVVED